MLGRSQTNKSANQSGGLHVLNEEKSENIRSLKVTANSKLTPETRPNPNRKGESIPTIHFQAQTGRFREDRFWGAFAGGAKKSKLSNSSDTSFSLKLIGFKHLTIG